ncbi:MAG: energy-coupled thiamine transporter ThiT [Oscillospiraceae bacterium]|nr:energy-coupled thiamine transporter ThiT [Oscillospiraceae bacterium]
MNKRNTKVRALCESAILVALGLVLSLIKIYELPNGGSITAVSMLPIILIGVRWGLGWGLGSAFVYSLLQFLFGIYAISPLALFLDYILAFTVLGLSGLFRGKKYGLVLAAAVCGFLRFVVHWISGATVRASTLPAGVPVWYGSLTYNLSYMLPEVILTVLVAVLITIPLRRHQYI